MFLNYTSVSYQFLSAFFIYKEGFLDLEENLTYSWAYENPPGSSLIIIKL